MGAALVVFAMTTTAGHSIAQDKELGEASDFRVRVQAALRLSRAGGVSAKKDLENGLRDAHPAVRVACAVALGNMGDASSIAPLEQAMKSETFASVKTAMQESVAKLKGKAATPTVSIENAKYVVQLGSIRNSAAKDRSDLDGLMRAAAKNKAGTIKNAIVIESTDSSSVQRASERKIPVLLVDGSLSSLTSKPSPDGGVVVTAKVDLSVRKIPQQTLKATITGNASATDNSNASAKGIQELQNRAVNGAVESAMSSVSSEIATLVK